MTSRFGPAIFLALFASMAFGAEYPSRPIRLIVPFTAGSAADILARTIGPKLSDAFGQQVVMDDRPSAGGTAAGTIVATAAPDGHTLMLTSSAFAGSAALYDKLPYDSIRDFTGVSLITLTALLLSVSPALGPKSVKELIALAQQKPGGLNFSSAGIGSGTHYGGELFNLAAGIKAVHVPYRGTPEAITDLMSGRMHYGMSPPLTAMPHVRGGAADCARRDFPAAYGFAPGSSDDCRSGLAGFRVSGMVRRACAHSRAASADRQIESRDRAHHGAAGCSGAHRSRRLDGEIVYAG